MDAVCWDAWGVLLICFSIGLVWTRYVWYRTSMEVQGDPVQNRPPVQTNWLRKYQDCVFEGDTSAVDENGFGFLHLAARDNQIHVLEDLVSFGESVNAYSDNQHRVFPIHMAAVCGRKEALKFLISQNAMVEAIDAGGNTALHAAVSALQLEECHLLLHHGASVNAVNFYGLTPLHVVVGITNQRIVGRIVEMLISHGANIEIESRGGKTPLQVAIECNNQKMIQMLVMKGAKYEPSPSDALSLPSNVYSFLKHAHDNDFRHRINLQKHKGFEISQALFVSFGFLNATAQFLLVFLRDELHPPDVISVGVCLCSGAVFWLFYYRLMGSNPGKLTKDKKDIVMKNQGGEQGQSYDEVKQSEEDDGDDGKNFCYTCCVKRPLRSRHCGQCGVCIDRMDHHCDWAGVCVGRKNYHLFLITITALAAGTIQFIYSAILYLEYHNYHQQTDSSKRIEFYEHIQWGLYNKPWVTLQLLLSLMVASLNLFPMLLNVLYTAVSNLTLAEVLTSHTDPRYMDGGRYWKNPNDRGMILNIIDWGKIVIQANA